MGWRLQGITKIPLERILVPGIPAESIETLDLDVALSRIRSASGVGLILGYSEHDLNIITTHCSDAELIGWFKAHSVNAKTIIDR